MFEVESDVDLAALQLHRRHHVIFLGAHNRLAVLHWLRLFARLLVVVALGGLCTWGAPQIDATAPFNDASNE